jgi:alpha-1,2-mannosyltransferase
LFLVLVPGLYLGTGRNLTMLGSWVDRMVRPFVVAGTVTSDHLNQSLPGLVFRLSTHNPAIVAEKGAPEQFANWADWDAQTAGWLIKACMAAFAGLAVWSCRTPIRERQGWRLAAEFSLVVLGMLLFSERTWKHHCVTLILPFAVISYYLAAGQPSRALRAYLVGTLTLAFLLMSLTSTTGIHALAVFDEAAKQALVYGAYVWAYLVLTAALVVLLRKSAANAVAEMRTVAEADAEEARGRCLAPAA